jgi:hypothetical protein
LHDQGNEFRKVREFFEMKNQIDRLIDSLSLDHGFRAVPEFLDDSI